MLIARAVILSPHSNRSSATNTVSTPPGPTPAIRICSSNESMCITTKLREVLIFVFTSLSFFFSSVCSPFFRLILKIRDKAFGAHTSNDDA